MDFWKSGMIRQMTCNFGEEGTIAVTDCLPKILFSEFGKRQNQLGKRTLSPTANSIFPFLEQWTKQNCHEQNKQVYLMTFRQKKEKWTEQNYQM